MLDSLKRDKSAHAAGTRVLCQFCGNATPYSAGATCPQCGISVATFDADKLEPAFDVAPSEVRFLRPIHDTRADGSQDRGPTWLRLMADTLHLRQMSTVADIGCGVNALLTSLAETYSNLRCTGFDFLPVEPTGPAAERLEVRFLDLESGKIPLDDKSQDLVTCSHCLEHIENAHALLAEMLRVGKNVLVILPNDMIFSTLLRSALKDGPAQPHGMPLGRPADRHRWMFTPTQAEKMMRHAAGRAHKRLRVFHYVDPRVPVALGRLNKNLFVVESAFLLSDA